jgi:glycosyltransferase involved in cell wall biosynthesis
MKLVLILMIRNEEKILRRCLDSVKGVVDAFCIMDTGSTDSTCSIAEDFLKENPGCLSKSTWRDFGHNRSLSFNAAQAWLKTHGWDLKDTYGLLLDADMQFVPGTLRNQNLDQMGYTMIQVAGTLEYPNTRVVRMDFPWVCRGVTHEYWDGPTVFLPKDVCYINDHNDGGCKSDKFTRDLALLMKGLDEDPRNVRYMFYIAQTFHSLEKWNDAIKWYTKRIEAGGWFEEVWYSMYMISKTQAGIGNPIEAEMWVQKAYAYRPQRAEAIYHFAKYLRMKGDSYKAMHYINLGKKIPLSTDALFIEHDVYKGLFDYEDTLVRYYIQSSLLDGLKSSVTYLMRDSPMNSNVMSNLPFYIEPLKSQVGIYPIIRDLGGFDYHPSSISICDDIHNVRFVNYQINHVDGSYTMKNGKYSTENHVRTQNAVVIKGVPKMMDDGSVTMPRRDAHIKGLEDVRIYRNAKGVMSFVATSLEYSEKIRIVRGTYNVESATYSDCVVMNSPQNQDCEKNWIPVNDTDDVIYRWSPLEIGRFDGSDLKIINSYPMPWLFKHFRGSAIPVKVGDELWTLVHFVEYSMPRKYFHCFVALNPTNYKPTRVSVPFVFRQKTIEYCLGVTIKGKQATCFVSTMDDSPTVVIFDTTQLVWFQM